MFIKKKYLISSNKPTMVKYAMNKEIYRLKIVYTDDTTSFCYHCECFLGRNSLNKKFYFDSPEVFISCYFYFVLLYAYTLFSSV